MALDLATVRQHVETGLVDAALTRIMEDAVDEVEARFGTDAALTYDSYPTGPTVVLPRKATSITSVELIASDGTVQETLSVSDYRLRNSRILERLSGGSLSYDWVKEYDAPGWNSTMVRVVFVPVPEESLRDRVALDLIRLQVQYEGVATQKVGDYSMTAFDYTKERERILQGVSNRRGLRIA